MVEFRGLAQMNVFATDVAAARDWYTAVFGVRAYFQQPDDSTPEYVEFRLGVSEDEFGIVSADYRHPAAAMTPGGAIARWHVDDIRTAVGDLVSRGATVWEPVIEREGGFFTASVLDPFGNILGLIESPHFAAQAGVL